MIEGDNPQPLAKLLARPPPVRGAPDAADEGPGRRTPWTDPPHQRPSRDGSAGPPSFEPRSRPRGEAADPPGYGVVREGTGQYPEGLPLLMGRGPFQRFKGGRSPSAAALQR
jgi:hypothetical protein